MTNNQLIYHFTHALLYVLVIIFVIFFLYKTINNFKNIEQDEAIYIVDRIYLNSSHFICVVKIYNKNFVLAVTPYKITILHISSKLKKHSD
ncbi:type III protein export, membrane component [Buchnera aphidicola (Cinara tujafilina)]|uniref:Type III protein export, membrane component n=1 Tax=Buchnera aphidicola (Cinara tujafilina) TaxID=261317 RepID=F7WYZ1_9GAMM|nr:flagellar biosynthetic protein FliO [Buchnera aphidicola]AEH39641.1 type III protein export, membrane component [Buchnera aphidicola (Cinara tujafilina)]